MKRSAPARDALPRARRDRGAAATPPPNGSPRPSRPRPTPVSLQHRGEGAGGRRPANRTPRARGRRRRPALRQGRQVANLPTMAPDQRPAVRAARLVVKGTPDSGHAGVEPGRLSRRLRLSAGGWRHAEEDRSRGQGAGCEAGVGAPGRVPVAVMPRCPRSPASSGWEWSRCAAGSTRRWSMPVTSALAEAAQNCRLSRTSLG